MEATDAGQARSAVFSVPKHFLIMLSVLLSWSAVVFCGWATCEIFPSIREDILASVGPLVAIHMSGSIAWALSVLSSIAEVLLGFAWGLEEALKMQIPELGLPHIDERHIRAIVKGCYALLAYDGITNAITAWQTTRQPDIWAHLLATAFTTLILTFSEILTLVCLALTLASAIMAVKVTGIAIRRFNG